MRIWLTSIVVAFGLIELLDWVQELSLPMPIFMMGGLFLAIASNYGKLKDLPIHFKYKEPDSTQKVVSPSPTPPVQITPQTKSTSSISFEIRKPFRPGD